MAQPIVMPSFGMYTAEGIVAAWLRPSGAYVNEGDPVLEIETEKSTLEVVAPASGFLHQVAGQGAPVEVAALVGYILAEGESAPAKDAAPEAMPFEKAPSQESHENHARGEVIASPIAKRLAAEHGLDIATLVGTGPGGRIGEADVRAALTRSNESDENVVA